MKKDIGILLKFIHTYCRHNHLQDEKLIFNSPHIQLKNEISLCSECASLANYSVEKRAKCPLKNKPSCKNCKIKCYNQDYRSKIKKVMKFSGIYYIKRGRIDYLIKYLF